MQQHINLTRSNKSAHGVGWLAALILSVAVGLPSGCMGVSDDELNKLKEGNQALAAELEAEKKESELLNRALTSVYRERDSLVDKLSTLAVSPLAPAATAPAEIAAPRIHVVKTGETLGSIASRYNTSVKTLVELNQYLQSRRDFMVWPNDQLTLPAE
ncbi:MAG: LysM peptidoglycan-binding domain-containing protein [Deltaproteobacteria bacterium]|jgi:LysM repeat protein|nr:LysM peptidoglycan-binding domain-containing protein [Deltaproteobacteria bacterium]